MLLQRLNEARRMMDKLRACIVANYFANAGMTKVPEVSPHRSSVLNCCHGNWPKTAVLFFPSMLPRMTRLFWTTRPSDGSWSHRPAPLLPSTRAPRPPPWASRSRNPSRSREMNLRKTACTEKTVAGRTAGLDATRAEWVETTELIFLILFHPFDLSGKLYFDVAGHIWRAVVSWNRAPSYVSHLWTWVLQTLCKEDNRSGKRIQVCTSIDAI